jgi:required for meiotic nuclear division protein 1
MSGMENTLRLSAIRIANQLDLKGIKTLLDKKSLADTSSELFYASGEKKFEYYFNYGVAVFCNYTDEEVKAAVKKIQHFLKSPDAAWLWDDHEILVLPDSEIVFEFDQVIVDRVDEKIIRIIMLNLAQSVALDYYHAASENLLTEIRGFTNNLATTGRFRMNRSNMMKFIGRALNTQNDIAENIYIFDTPEEVWEDEYLDKLHRGLVKHFDLRVRFSEIEYMLRIIDNNLSVFREISNQRESNLLEWIIIILILVEVFDLFISKFL